MDIDDLLSPNEDELMKAVSQPKTVQTPVTPEPAAQAAPTAAVPPVTPVTPVAPVTPEAPASTAESQPATAATSVPFSLDDMLSAAPQVAQEPEVKKEIFEKLSPVDQEKSVAMAKQLDYQKRETLLKYGIKVTSNIDNFSKKVLESAHEETSQKNVNDDLQAIVAVLKTANVRELLDEPKVEEVPESKGLFGFFGHKPAENKLVQKDKVERFRDVSQRIDVLKEKMSIDQRQLIKDTEMLKKLYDQNLLFFQALNIFIAGLEVYQEQLVTKEIPELRQKLAETQDGMIGEKIQVVQKYVNAVERKIYDFRTVRQVSLNQAPAIRLIQDNNVNLVDKIQSSIMITLPTWRTNFVTVLATIHQRDMAQTQHDVNDLTNDLLKESSDLLHNTTVDTARENERAVIDIETLEYTQNQLMASIDETLQIQQEGRERRQASTQRLNELEQQLKEKLLSISNGEEQ